MYIDLAGTSPGGLFPVNDSNSDVIVKYILHMCFLCPKCLKCLSCPMHSRYPILVLYLFILDSISKLQFLGVRLTTHGFQSHLELRFFLYSYSTSYGCHGFYPNKLNNTLILHTSSIHDSRKEKRAKL